MTAAEVFSVLGGIALVVCAGCLVALHVLPTGYNPVADAVSYYAVSRFGILYRVQAIASGIAGLCLLVVFAASGLALPFLGIMGLSAYALSRMMIAFFPTDVGGKRTPRGRIHNILAIFTFAGILFAVVSITPVLAGLPAWASVCGILNVVLLFTIVSAILFLASIVARPLRRFFGLIERCVYAGAIVWMGVVFFQR